MLSNPLLSKTISKYDLEQIKIILINKLKFKNFSSSLLVLSNVITTIGFADASRYILAKKKKYYNAK